MTATVKAADLPEGSVAFQVGDVVHGFAGGSFGRDSYGCRRVEAVGADWIVTRNQHGQVELASREYMPTREDAENRGWCRESCVGPEED